jgi:hypothetical protein
MLEGARLGNAARPIEVDSPAERGPLLVGPGETASDDAYLRRTVRVLSEFCCVFAKRYPARMARVP